MTSILTINLYQPKDTAGVFIAVFLITVVYAAFGNLIGSFYPKIMEGSLIVLLVSFIDLMIISNPMGESLYLQSWTYYVPGFWPTQLVLEAGFIGKSADIISYAALALIYAIILFASSQLVKFDIWSKLKALRGVRT